MNKIANLLTIIKSCNEVGDELFNQTYDVIVENMCPHDFDFDGGVGCTKKPLHAGEPCYICWDKAIKELNE